MIVLQNEISKLKRNTTILRFTMYRWLEEAEIITIAFTETEGHRSASFIATRLIEGVT